MKGGGGEVRDYEDSAGGEWGSVGESGEEWGRVGKRGGEGGDSSYLIQYQPAVIIRNIQTRPHTTYDTI